MVAGNRSRPAPCTYNYRYGYLKVTPTVDLRCSFMMHLLQLFIVIDCGLGFA